MNHDTLTSDTARFDIIRWISDNNAYTPISELEHLTADPSSDMFSDDISYEH